MYQLILERQMREGPPRMEDVVVGQWQANEMGVSVHAYGSHLKIGSTDSIRVFNLTDDVVRLGVHRIILMRDGKQVWEMTFDAYPEHVDEMVERLCLKTTAPSPSL